MKKLSFMAVLALSTMLTACSSGGSGGGSSFIPGTGGGNGGGGSSIPVTSLPDGSTVPESGTSIQTVNNSQRRTANYENAVEAVGSTATGVAVLSTKASSNATAEEINNAYSNMNKILVNQDFTNATKEDILLSLAMAGEDIEGLKDKSLDDIKTAAQDLAIKSKAEDVYARLGTERDLSLKDVTFYDPEYALDKADGAIYNFIIDKDGNLTGLQETDDGGASVLEFNRNGDGKYKIDKALVNYGFQYMVNGYPEGLGTEITMSKTATLDEIKAAFKTSANASWKSQLSDDVMNAMLAWIDGLTMSDLQGSEEEQEGKGINFGYSEPCADSAILTYGSIGKGLGLKYSDFGSITYDVKLGNETDKDTTLFYGGYDKLSAKASDLPQVDTEMNFEGKAVANVWAEHKDTDIETSKLYNGTADLTFKDGKETLVADFTDWHKVTIETNESAYSGYDISISGTAKDATYALENPDIGGADIRYYGENPKNPDEAVGTATFWGNNDTHWVDAEMVFGGTLKE